MYLLYDFIFLLYAIVYLPYLLLTKRVYPGFGMRFGLFSKVIKEQINAKTNIWLHAVSVGEVMVLDSFIGQLSKKYPAYQCVVTVTTKTGYAFASQRLRGKALVLPSPLDFGFVVSRFVSLIRPKIYIAVETEIWPNIYRQLFDRKISLVVINGRISDNSYERYKAIRFLLKRVLNQVTLWCMQSPGDAQRIIALGAEDSRVLMTGNIKFDDLPADEDSPICDFNKVGLWWVAGSTHPGEEEMVLDVYEQIIQDRPEWRLMIVPRHIERVAQIMELIERRCLTAMKFSEFNNLNLPNLAFGKSAKTVVVVDTIGHLRSIYAKASLVFVGKSLCVGGGHNVIEPAFYGKPIVIGPKVENFRDIVDSFKNSDAIVQVENAYTFEKTVRNLCLDASRRESLGVAARGVIANNQGATRRILERMEGLLA